MLLCKATIEELFLINPLRSKFYFSCSPLSSLNQFLCFWINAFSYFCIVWANSANFVYFFWIKTSISVYCLNLVFFNKIWSLAFFNFSWASLYSFSIFNLSVYAWWASRYLHYKKSTEFVLRKSIIFF